MLTPTDYTVDPKIFQELCNQLPEKEMKTPINQPNGSFFYDPWVIKDEYKDTVWETIYNSLPVAKGEARIIILDPAQCYQVHADIDDRYHLNILGEECYLIDLVKYQMHRLTQDGIWYNMNAGLLHTATNFGRRSRIQLVVRHLLNQNKLKDPQRITITSSINLDDARFIFDNTVSVWLNTANKKGIIADFSYKNNQVEFDIEKTEIETLLCLLDGTLIVKFL
jgi:hypothetical protein